MSKYEIAMEISGPFAMWSRPDTGATPTSYPGRQQETLISITSIWLFQSVTASNPTPPHASANGQPHNYANTSLKYL